MFTRINRNPNQHWTEPETDNLLWLVWETPEGKFGASHSQASHIQFPNLPGFLGAREYLASTKGEECRHWVEAGLLKAVWLVDAKTRYQAIKKLRRVPALQEAP